MKKCLATLLLIIITTLCHAQDYLSPINRLNGIEMEKQLFIKYDESTNNFLYYKDHDRTTLLQLTEGDLINIKGTDNGKYTLAIEFYNPLRVKFNFDETRIADPSIEAINTFISKFPTEFVQFNLVEAEKKEQAVVSPSLNKLFSPSDELSYWKYDFEFVKSGKNTERDINVDIFLSSYIISQWVYEFYSALEGKVNASDSAKLQKLFEEISQIKEAEKYLFGKISIDNKSQALNNWILDVQHKMYEETSAEGFGKQLSEAKKVYEHLQQAKEKAETALEQFFDLITNKYNDRIEFFFLNKETDQDNVPIIKEVSEKFKDYSAASTALINILIDPRRKNNDEALKKFNDFIETLQKFYNQFQVQSSRFVKVLQTSQISHNDGIIKDIFISASRLDEKGTENNKVTRSVNFNISRWNSMYPIVSTGSLFTNFSFPDYTVDSTNSIVNVSRKKIRATPVMYLNFYTNWLKNDYLYFFLQFGIAPLNDNGSILVPIGAGFSIGGALANRITISGGFLPAFVKELNKLNVGDKVKDNAVLKDDLSYKLYSTSYFSININLFK